MRTVETLIVGSLAISLVIVLVKNSSGTDTVIKSLAGAHATIFKTLQGA